MKTLALLAAAICLASCAPPAYPVDSPNPLDQPDTRELTQAELHRKNLVFITGNPAY